MPEMHNPVRELENKPIGSLLLQYSIPAIIAMTVTSLYNIIAGIFIGHGIGALALTGLAASFPLFNLMGAFCFLVAVGGATQSSIALGRKDIGMARQILGHVVVLELLISVLFSALALLFLDPVLMLFGASEETLPYARDYMRVLLLTSPIGFLMLGLNTLLRATGYPRKAMITALLSVVVSTALSPLFIFSWGWGMSGAALATVAAQTVSIVWILFHFFSRKHVVCFQRGIFGLHLSVIRPILAVGLAPFLLNACACLVVMVINIQLRSHGGDLAVGALGILNRIHMLFVMVISGLTMGMQPIIGFNFGAQCISRVRKTLRYGLVTAGIISLSGFLGFELLPYWLARMFTSNAELTELAMDALRLSSIVFFLVGPQIVIAAFFQSIGMPSIAIFLSLTRQMLFLIPSLLIFPVFWGLKGVWISLPLADMISFLVGVFMLWWQIYRKKGGGLFTSSVVEDNA